MAAVVQFETSKFDLASEPENKINPIYGQSILQWIMERCPNIKFVTDPCTEDWGWYVYAEWNERRYLVGASASFEEPNDAFCTVQIQKNRTVREKLLGKEKLEKDDDLVTQISALFLNNPEFSSVELSFD